MMRATPPPRWLTLLGVLALWQLIAGANAALAAPIYNPRLLPPPSEVLAAGFELAQSGELLAHIGASLARITLGVGAAIGPAVLLGLGVARLRWVMVLVEPVIDLLRALPPLALLPMFILWLGVGELAKVFFVAYGCFFIIFFATAGAARGIDPVLIRAARSLGLRGVALARYVIVPAVLPQVAASVRFAVSAAAIGILASEYVAAQSGLGYLINHSRTFFRVDRMLLGALLLALIGLLINAGLLALERRWFGWRQPAE